MTNEIIQLLLRPLALPLSAGATVTASLIIHFVATTGIDIGALEPLALIFIVAAIVGGLCGWPFVALANWLIPTVKARHLLSGMLASSALPITVAIHRRQLSWASITDWRSWLHSDLWTIPAIGLVAGALYTGLLMLIDRRFPASTEPSLSADA